MGESLSAAKICEKAKQLLADLLKRQTLNSGESTEMFKDSHGWFNKFKKRTGVHSVVRHGEAASGN